MVGPRTTNHKGLRLLLRKVSICFHFLNLRSMPGRVARHEHNGLVSIQFAKWKIIVVIPEVVGSCFYVIDACIALGCKLFNGAFV